MVTAMAMATCAPRPASQLAEAEVEPKAGAGVLGLGTVRIRVRALSTRHGLEPGAWQDPTSTVSGASSTAAKAFEAQVRVATTTSEAADPPPTPHARPMDLVAIPNGDLGLMADAAATQAVMDEATQRALTTEHGLDLKATKNDNSAGVDHVIPLSESQKALMELRANLVAGKVAQAQKARFLFFGPHASTTVPTEPNTQRFESSPSHSYACFGRLPRLCPEELHRMRILRPVNS